MQRFRQYTPFVVLEFETEVWEYPPHTHNYYEVIFIVDGEGVHTINDRSFPYVKGDVFLLNPQDCHSFLITERTSFCFFKFTELLFRVHLSESTQNKWLTHIESIIAILNLMPGPVPLSPGDKILVQYLYSIILDAYRRTDNFSNDIISDAMSTLLCLLARSISQNDDNGISTDLDVNNDLIDALLTYIRVNVFQPKLVSVNVLSFRFGLSKNYIGTFFKKHTGESLQNYILNYRLLLAENKIIYSNETIYSIANSLGFSDASHFNKYFKRRFGMMPGKYRKVNRSVN